VLRLLQAEGIDHLRALNATMRQVLEECTGPLKSDLTARYEPILGYPSNDRKFALDMPPVPLAMAAKAETP
jgi:hypothetical protein